MGKNGKAKRKMKGMVIEIVFKRKKKQNVLSWKPKEESASKEVKIVKWGRALMSITFKKRNCLELG